MPAQLVAVFFVQGYSRQVLSIPSSFAEFALVAACCRWPPSDESDRAVTKAASGPIDWDRFLRTARRHRVEGLAASALPRLDIGAPAAMRQLLASARIEITRQNLAYAAEAARLRKMLEAEAIPLLFLKGLTLDALAYDSLAIKKSRDIDIVVSAEAAELASDAMEQGGYRRIEPAAKLSQEQFRTWLSLNKETVWRHVRSGIVVEIHTSLVDNPLLLPSVGIGSPTREVAIAAGISLPTLQKDELFSYLCVHGAAHAWSRLKWLADLAALLKDDGTQEIERLYESSLGLGAGRCSAQALLLCADLLGLELPPSLTARLGGSRANRRLVRLALRAMTSRREIELDDTLLGTVPIHLSHFALMKGWRYKAAELRRKMRSPHDRANVPLPRLLRFLYPIILLPSWLLRRARLNVGS